MHGEIHFALFGRPRYPDAMAYDYDKLYGETPDALGSPTKAFVDFFDRFGPKPTRVLDVGCGQGRDALFIARRGHSVLDVDLSPNGISDLEAAARQDGLAIEAVVADVTTYTPPGLFGVIVIDRTLHMLGRAERMSVLAALLDHVEDHGWLLIADEPSNMADFRSVLSAHRAEWATEYQASGYLFAKRA
ncbi:class I SAM-dependent methyltransferase [Limimaricola pyoseonensis]|uniref:Methyltransferase domain-containing protein n=1 Tax=Limimaricola pyoseonensis TaxID=521013 RepID=A0A1G7EFF3_9RHOB|nr:class I SAM-dependent methyltransferase [Limimaricola pyoseonensis]SDE62155.1 Methyltransferase domain-containing protein [Limimaricola pyoseonensis]